MIRVLLSKISSAKHSAAAADNYARCKLFPKTPEYDQPEKKLTSLIGHLMCEKLFFDLNITQHELETLHQSQYGKWQFTNSRFDFSISHSHEYVVVAITDAGRVGVDIEKPRALRVSPYKDCFTSTEWRKIQSARNNQQLFFDYWTKKESLLKAWGFGLQIPLDQVSVEDSIGRIVNTEMEGFFSAIAVPGYSCCLCSTVEVETIRFEEFSFEM